LYTDSGKASCQFEGPFVENADHFVPEVATNIGFAVLVELMIAQIHLIQNLFALMEDCSFYDVARVNSYREVYACNWANQNGRP